MYSVSNVIDHSYSSSGLQPSPVRVLRSIHQSIPIVMALSPELRSQLPTVGGFQVVFRPESLRSSTSAVMVHNLDYLTLSLDQISTLELTIMSGQLKDCHDSYCSHFQQEST